MTVDHGKQSDPETTSDNGLMNRRNFLVGSAAVGSAVALSTLPSLGGAQREPMSFTVRIENVASEMIQTSTGDMAPVVLSPGAFAVHTAGEPMFSHGEPERNNGLEEIAEDGMPGRLAASLADDPRVAQSGAFAVPVGADGPGPLTPGNAYEFEITDVSPPAQYLSLVTMFVQSNDLFFELGGPDGLKLFDGNQPMTGDVTEYVRLWDAGTEINEEPGVGENQAPRQTGAGVGLVERDTVVPISEVNGYDYPETEDVIEVTITPAGES